VGALQNAYSDITQKSAYNPPTEYQPPASPAIGGLMTTGDTSGTNPYGVPDDYQSAESQAERYDYGLNTAGDTGGGMTGTPYSTTSSDSDFLNNVYLNETGRTADTAGQQYWSDQMAAGMSRDDVIAGFNASAEGTGYDAYQASQPPPEAPPETPTAPTRDVALTGASATGYEPTAATPAATAPVTTATAPGQAATTGYQATGQQIGPDALSVNQLNKMTATDSDYMQQARLAGMQYANSRGLKNSSIGAGAAQAEAIKAAAPFALQDAAGYLTAGRDLANAENRASEFGASAENVAALQDAGQQADISKFNASAQNLAENQQTAASNQMALANATAINSAGQFYAGAQNTASIQNANNELSVALKQMGDDLATYQTDQQRAAAMDTIAYNLTNMAMTNGVFNNPDTMVGFFNTVSGIFPELGIQVVTDMADTIPASEII